MLVVDDEATARRRTSRLLGALPDVELAGELDSAEALLSYLDEEDVDVVLLDIQMTGMSGLEARARIPEDGPYVIFATAHPEHAVKAFELGAIDYVLKPFDEERLGKAIERAQRFYAQREPGARKTSGASVPERLALETQKGIVLVDPAHVSHAVLEGALVSLHVCDAEGARSFVTEKQLVELEGRLGDRVERVHRRALVSFAFVERLEPQPTGGYLAHMKNGDRVEISRQSARRLRRRLGIG